MQRVRLLAPITMAAGTVLALSDEQAHDRRHALSPRGGGVYEAIAPVSFKAGAEIGCSPHLPKALGALVEDLLSQDATPEPAPKPRRKTK